MTETVGAFSFLFNSSHPSAPSWYGGRFDPAFLLALKASDPQSQTQSWLLRGDLLLHHLGARVTAVEQDERGSFHTMGYDRNVVKTAIFDFTQWVQIPPSRFDAEKLQHALLQLHVAHCLTATCLHVDIARAIDLQLQSDPLYLGMAAVDLGNPVMTTLLMEYLIRDTGVAGGQVWFEADYDGDVHTLFEGAEEFSPNGSGILQSGELFAEFGPFPDAELSPEGSSAVYRHEQKSRLTLQERVLAHLARDGGGEGSGPFRFDALEAKGLFEASVPPPKLTHYALNPDHPEGAGKAKFFNEVLGIGPEDWRYLMAQIQEGVRSADLTDFRIKRWGNGKGASFNAVLSIIGRNGRAASVFTNWIMEPEQTPRLSTIRPVEQGDQEPVPVEPPLAPVHFTGDQKWQAIYDLANMLGMAAHDSAVPTPMFVEGYGGYSAGECGFAFVHVPDARRDFARWLLKTGRAYKGYPTGVTISCPRGGQSVDRAYAYATAFARVLEYNSLMCRVERLLD